MERIVPSASDCTTEWWKQVKILIVLISAKVQDNVDLVRVAN